MEVSGIVLVALKSHRRYQMEYVSRCLYTAILTPFKAHWVRYEGMVTN